jgi:hypothetical protein
VVDDLEYPRTACCHLQQDASEAIYRIQLGKSQIKKGPIAILKTVLVA